MKILYAASKSEGSYLQLARYLPQFNESKHEFRIAGYYETLRDLNANYCLDALQHFASHTGVKFNNNFRYYVNEIKRYKPDLIISDLEFYSSRIGFDLGIPVWQVSPNILRIALPIVLQKRYGFRKFNRSNLDQDDIRNIVNYSKRKLVLSYLCDIDNPPELKAGYEWCRPEFVLDERGTEPADSLGYMPLLADHFYNQRYTLIDYQKSSLETITTITSHIYHELGQFKSHPLKPKTIIIHPNETVSFLMDLL